MGLNIAGMTDPAPGTIDLMGTGAVGVDTGYVPGYTTVVPDVSSLDLPGQFLSMPGGYSNNGPIASADPSGVNQLYSDSRINPTPTGGYMDAALKLITAGIQGFTTYAKGSPSVAVPASKQPAGFSLGGNFLTTPQGGTNWFAVGAVAVVAVLGIGLVVHYA